MGPVLLFEVLPYSQIIEVKRRGLTLVEVMVITSIVALLAVVAIQSLTRSRVVTIESTVIANLRTLANSLEMYHSANQQYPGDWQADLYTNVDPDFGPPGFNLPMNGSTLQGYTYTYSPLPSGCTSACIDYTLSSIPQTVGATGTRAFLVDRSGIIRHCVGAGPANVSNQPIGQAPNAC